MLRDESCEVIENEGAWVQPAKLEDWREVDRGLCRNARRRGELDAEEAELLRAGYRIRIWREVGAISMIEYLELRLGYAPRTAQERLRVALALGELPALTAALATSEHPFTAVRELARVVTPATEEEWLDQVQGMTVHEVQQEVSGHKKGNRPGDDRDPDLKLRTCRFDEVRPSTIALERQARTRAQEERGERLSDDEFLAMMYGAYLAGAPSARTPESAEPAKSSGRARFQVAVTICERCEQGWQEGGGRKFAMDASEVARAKCDAQHLGSLNTSEPARATQDISPRVRRLVHRRDGGKCSLSWCRSAFHLELHHIVPRELGGSNKPWNIMQLCDGHHTALHRGAITSTGKAPDQLVVTRMHPPGARVGATGTITPVRGAHVGASDRVSGKASVRVGAAGTFTPDSSARVGATDKVTGEAGANVGASDKLTRATMRVEACTALVTLGRHEAAAAVDAARAHVGAQMSLEVLIREALRRCARSTS